VEYIGQHADALLHLIGWTLTLGGVAIVATLRALDDRRRDETAAIVRAGRRVAVAGGLLTAPIECGGLPWPDDDRSVRRRRGREQLLGSARTSGAPPPGPEPDDRRLPAGRRAANAFHSGE
jgi:hypothetical protein